MELKNPSENNIFQVIGPSKQPGKVRVKAWDGKIYRIPDTMDTEAFAERLREKKGPGLFGSLSASIQYSVPQIYRSTLASVYDTLGAETEQAEQEKLAKENEDLFNKVAGQYAIPSAGNIISKKGLLQTSSNLATYAAQQIGFSAPQMVAVVGGAATGAAYGAPALGAAAISAPFFYAQNVDRQRQEKNKLKEVGIISDIEYDQGKALLAAGVQAGLEGVVGGVLFNGSKIVNGITTKLGFTPGTAASQTFLKTMAAVASTNAITEVGQQMAERWQADLTLLDDAAKQEYLEAGIAAAIVGVPLGAAGHFVRRPAKIEDTAAVANTIDTEPLGPEEKDREKVSNPLLYELERAIVEQFAPIQQSAKVSPKDLISSVFNVSDDAKSYGIADIAQAKEYIRTLPNGEQYLSSLEKANTSDSFIIESARNNARLQEQQRNYSSGITGLTFGNRGVIVDSENIATQYSDEPRIRNMAAILQSKYGYDYDHLRGLQDTSIEKLFALNVDREEQRIKALPKPPTPALLPPFVPDQFTDLPEAPRTPSANPAEPYSLLQDYAAPSEIPTAPGPPLDFQKQLLDPNVGNDVADAEYVRRAEEAATLDRLRKISDRLDRIEKANEAISPEKLEQQRKAAELLRNAKKRNQPDPKTNKKEKFKKQASKTAPKETNTDVPVEPNDFKLDKPLADQALIDKKDRLLNEAMAAQLREPKKYTKELKLPEILQGFLQGDLVSTARVLYGQGSFQIDLFTFDNFIKTNFKPSNWKALVNRHKVLLSAKLGIAPRDLDFWGDTAILFQGLQEFTQNKDKAFGNEIFKRFLDEQRKIQDYFKNTLKLELKPSVEAAIKADKIIKQQPVGEVFVSENGADVVKDLNKVEESTLKPRKEPSTAGSVLQYFTSYLASMKGMARTDPNYANVLNIQLAKEDLAGELTNEFANAYQQYAESPNFRTFADILAHMKETGQAIATDDKGLISYVDPNGVRKALDRTSSAEFIKHVDMWKHMGKKYLEIARERFNDFQELGLDSNSTPQQIAQVVAGLETQIKTDEFSKDVKEKARLQLGPLKEALQSFTDLMEMQASDRPYVPFSRFGDYAVKVTDISTGKMVHLEDYERPSLSGVQNLASQSEIDSFIKTNPNLIKFADKKKYRVEAFQKTYNNLQKFIPDTFITAELVASVLGSSNPVLNKLVIDFDNAEGLNKELKQGFRDAKLAKERALRYVMGKGGSRFFLKSENIPGYSRDWGRVLQNHVQAMSRTAATIKTAPEYAKVFQEIQTGQMPEWKRNQLNSYLEYMYSATSEAGYNQFLRAFNFFYTMGFNASTAILQFATVPTHIIPAMHETGFNPISDMRNVLHYTTKAMQLVTFDTNFERNPKVAARFRPDELDFLNRHKEVLQANQVVDAMGLADTDVKSIKGRIKLGTEKVVNTSGILIDRAERSTRYGMALALYNKLRNNPDGVAIFENMHKDNQDWQAFKQNRSDLPIHEAITHYQVRDVHGIFGKAGRGPSQRGLLGSSVFPFTTYVAQTLERMYDIGANRGLRGKAELAQIMLTYIALAGVAGIPGYELAEELGSEVASYLTGIRTSIKKEIRDYAEKNGYNPILVEKGALTAYGEVDVAHRIGLQLVVGRLLTDAFRLAQGKDIDIAQYNPTLGLLPRIGRVAENATRGRDFLETINPALPTFLRNINTAYNYANEKLLETSKGNPFPMKESLNIWDLANQAGGFTPNKITQAREDLFFGKSFQKGKFTLIKERYADQIARLKYKATQEPQNAVALNRQANALYNELVATLKGDPEFKATADFFTGFNRSIQNRINEKKNPEVNIK